MQILLTKFEQYVDETILKRGLSYFNNGHVHVLEEVCPGEYEAIVEGTEDYRVDLTLKNGIITEYSCDCPYDIGPICKHVVAVIFQLKKDELYFNEKATMPKTKQGIMPAKKKTIAEQVNELLEKTTYDELKQFIRQKTVDNTSFRDLFLSSFAHLNSDESLELYAKQVASMIRTASDSHGFINWSATSVLTNSVDNLLESANKQIDNRNYKSAFFMCAAVMEELMKALEISDDSSGEIGGSINSAFEMLKQISKQEFSEEFRKLLIEYCFKAFEKRVYDGWDWHIDVLRIASLLLKTEEDTELIFALLDNVSSSDWQRQEAQSLKYEILLKVKGEQEAELYLEQNISNSNLRKEAISNAFAKKNFEKARSLAQDGVEYDEKDSPGLVVEWYDWLLKIAQAQNDVVKIIEFSQHLFIRNFYPQQDYYQLLKRHVNPENWNEFVEALILDIIAQKRGYYMDLIASVFIKEEWWDRLLELVKKTPTLTTIERYEKYLSINYVMQIVDLYANAVVLYVQKNTGREHYKTACKYIRLMSKLGANEKANAVISLLRAEFPQRRALLDELRLV